MSILMKFVSLSAAGLCTLLGVQVCSEGMTAKTWVVLGATVIVKGWSFIHHDQTATTAKDGAATAEEKSNG